GDVVARRDVRVIVGQVNLGVRRDGAGARLIVEQARQRQGERDRLIHRHTGVVEADVVFAIVVVRFTAEEGLVLLFFVFVPSLGLPAHGAHANRGGDLHAAGVDAVVLVLPGYRPAAADALAAVVGVVVRT